MRARAKSACGEGVDDEGMSRLKSGHSKNQVGAVREMQGRNACSRFLIVDAQSAKSSDTTGQKGYRVDKEVSGIERHVVIDTQGTACQRGDSGRDDRP